jgi:CysZ protein
VLGDFVTGAGYLPRGFRLLWARGSRRYAVLPLLINLLVFAVLMLMGMNAFGGLIDSLMPAADGWWAVLARWLLWLAFGISLLLLMFFTFTLVANLLSAPFNGLLAAAVEYQLRGQTIDPPPDWAQLLRDVLPVLLNETGKFAYYLAWALPLLLLFIVPLLQLLAPAAWMLFSAWMMALQYLDYPMSKQQLRFRQVRTSVGQHRWLSLGFGAAVTTGTLLPVVNLFVMPAAVAGATALWLERFTASAVRDQDR